MAAATIDGTASHFMNPDQKREEKKKLARTELEKHILPPNRWNRAPDKVLSFIGDRVDSGKLIALGWHYKAGWFILSGIEKTRIVWIQKPEAMKLDPDTFENISRVIDDYRGEGEEITLSAIDSTEDSVIKQLREAAREQQRPLKEVAMAALQKGLCNTAECSTDSSEASLQNVKSILAAFESDENVFVDDIIEMLSDFIASQGMASKLAAFVSSYNY